MYELSTAAQADLLRVYGYAGANPVDMEAGLARLDDALRSKHEETRAFYAAHAKPDDVPNGFYEPRASGPPSENDADRSARQAGFLSAAWDMVSKQVVPDVTWPIDERRQWAHEVLAVVDLGTNPEQVWDGVAAWDAGADYGGVARVCLFVRAFEAWKARCAGRWSDPRVPRRAFLDSLKHGGGIERFEELVGRAVRILEPPGTPAALAPVGLPGVAPTPAESGTTGVAAQPRTNREAGLDDLCRWILGLLRAANQANRGMTAKAIRIAIERVHRERRSDDAVERAIRERLVPAGFEIDNPQNRSGYWLRK
jgi:hypothetical protein